MARTERVTCCGCGKVLLKRTSLPPNSTLIVSPGADAPPPPEINEGFSIHAGLDPTGMDGEYALHFRLLFGDYCSVECFEAKAIPAMRGAIQDTLAECRRQHDNLEDCREQAEGGLFRVVDRESLRKARSLAFDNEYEREFYRRGWENPT